MKDLNQLTEKNKELCSQESWPHEENASPIHNENTATEITDSSVHIDEERKLDSMSNYTLKIQDIETALLSAKKDIQILNSCFRSVIEQTISLEKTINSYYYEEGIVKICRLIEHIRRLKDDNAQIIAEELTYVLINTFHLSVINPMTGESFNPVEHENRDIANKGKKIHSCIMIGWKHNEKTLIRAIVETE